MYISKQTLQLHRSVSSLATFIISVVLLFQEKMEASALWLIVSYIPILINKMEEIKINKGNVT